MRVLSIVLIVMLISYAKINNNYYNSLVHNELNRTKKNKKKEGCPFEHPSATSKFQFIEHCVVYCWYSIHYKNTECFYLSKCSLKCNSLDIHICKGVFPYRLDAIQVGFVKYMIVNNNYYFVIPCYLIYLLRIYFTCSLNSLTFS